VLVFTERFTGLGCSEPCSASPRRKYWRRAEVYGWIIGVSHILAIAFIALFPIEQYVDFSYLPSIWTGKAILFLIYLAVFGSISV